jgi:hypothetical protein
LSLDRIFAHDETGIPLNSGDTMLDSSIDLPLTSQAESVHTQGLVSCFPSQTLLMARPLKIELPGAHYHLTARGNGRAPVFVDNFDRGYFSISSGILLSGSIGFVMRTASWIIIAIS